MRVFVSEFVCGGGWPEPELTGSLATEGRAMLRAAVEDFARIPGVQVTTTWDARLGPVPFENVHTIVVESPDDELPVFRELAQLCDATLVIAPEPDDVLQARCAIVERTYGRLLGPDSRAVAHCACKSTLASDLERAGVRTISTTSCTSTHSFTPPGTAARFLLVDPLPPFPIVIKPRNGAGSQSTYVVRDADEFAQFESEIAADPILSSDALATIVQPFIVGSPGTELEFAL